MFRKLLVAFFIFIGLLSCSERKFNNPVDPLLIDDNLIAPSEFSIRVVDVNVLELRWKDNSEIEDGYVIERSTDGLSYSQVAVVGANITQWRDTNISLGNTYSYRLRTKHESYSSVATTATFYYRLLAPTDLTTEQLTDTRIKLSWSDSNHFEDGYKIDLKIGEEDWQVDFASVPADSSHWFYDNTQINSPVLKWRIRAFYKTLFGTYSIEHSYTPFTVASPVFSVQPGSYYNEFLVQISCASEGAQIYYTTDGSEPTTSSNVYPGSVQVNQNTELKAKAFKSGWTASSTASASYALIVRTPIIHVLSGTYNNVFDVSISCATIGATIRYTTNGSEPASSSTQYTGPVSIASNTTLKAKAFKTGWNDSQTRSADYTFMVATPSINPSGGTYTTNQSVTISCTTHSATIRYTTNGNDPTPSSPIYTNPISITATTTLKAKAYLSNWDDSAVATSIYTITGTVATPTFNPAGGTYNSTQSVTISCTTPGATIRYTTNGTEPTSGSTQYTVPVSIASNTTLKAKAFKTDWNDSQTATAIYVIDLVFVQGGTFHNGTSNVTLSSFYIDKYEITQASYQAVMGTNPSNFGGNPIRPVERVSWFDAIEYCNRRSTQEGLTPAYSYSTHGTNPSNWPEGWNTSATNHTNVSCNWSANGYRLPTEMEWMFAAKGGNQSQGYTYSGSNTIGNVAWYDSNSSNRTWDVGLKASNELGTFDMSGNVREWVWDIWNTIYPAGNQTNPTGPVSGSFRVQRGGSWHCIADLCTVSYRYADYATLPYGYVGFRVLRVSP